MGAMPVVIALPIEIEHQLREQNPHLDETARDALLIDLYRQGNLSTGDIASVLKFGTRYESERWLADHGVDLNYSKSDLDADRLTLDRVLGTGSK